MSLSEYKVVKALNLADIGLSQCNDRLR